MFAGSQRSHLEPCWMRFAISKTLTCAFSFLVALRWPDGIVKCPTCGSEKGLFSAISARWKCSAKHDRGQFSIKVGNMFEDSPIGLDKWLPAAWLLPNCKNGISSLEV